MKKLLNYFLVASLVLVQFIPVANAASITINDSVVGQTYSAYKIFDVTKSGNNSYAYSIDSTSKWFDAVQKYATDNANTFTLTRVGTTTKYVVIPGENFKLDTNAKAFADYLNIYLKTVEEAKKPTPEESVEAKNGVETVIDGLAAGYYFVDSSLGALCILNTAADTMEVTEKNGVPTVDKTVSKSSASVGETVTFTVTLTAGGNADTDYILHDKMTDGLTLDTSSFAIKVDNTPVNERNYDIKTIGLTDGCTFEIEFNQAYTATLAQGKKIVITYDAVVNENAITDSEATNEAKVEYGNSSSQSSTETVKNYDFELVKVDKEGTQLSGAKFKLYKASGDTQVEIALVKDGNAYRPAKANERGVEIEAGKVRINGLSSGTYYLEETQAPDGYNQLTSRQEFTITDADLVGTSAVRVVNTTGAILPSTGGMGTVLFLTIGSIMVLGFGVLLVTKLRVSKMTI